MPSLMPLNETTVSRSTGPLWKNRKRRPQRVRFWKRSTTGRYWPAEATAIVITIPLPFRPELPRITAIRLEALTHPALPSGGPGRADDGNFLLSQIRLVAAGQVVSWLHATADHSQQGHDVAGAIDDDARTGWAIGVEKGRANVQRTATFVCDVVPATTGSQIGVELLFDSATAHHNLGRFRLAVTDDPHAKFKLPDPRRSELAAELKLLRDARDKFAKTIPETMVMRELVEGRESHVLIRGDFLRKGETVMANVPSSLPGLSGEIPSVGHTRYTRLDLARWLVDPANPLTSRVTVNRIWSHMFGRGIVETENDFGIQGTAPTHPHLLDWIAAEFVDRQWSVKSLHRLIVSSATYRQASHSRGDVDRVDPKNELLGRQNRLRVDAEIVRDLALAVSGHLQRQVGGPSVYPPQPEGVYAFTQRQAKWPTSQGADRYRRGLYTFFMRSCALSDVNHFRHAAFQHDVYSPRSLEHAIASFDDGQ